MKVLYCPARQGICPHKDKLWAEMPHKNALRHMTTFSWHSRYTNSHRIEICEPIKTCTAKNLCKNDLSK